MQTSQRENSQGSDRYGNGIENLIMQAGNYLCDNPPLWYWLCISLFLGLGVAIWR